MPGIRIVCEFCLVIRETAEQIFYGCKSVSTLRDLVLRSPVEMGIDCSSMTDEQNKCLISICLHPRKGSEVNSGRNIIMISETNQVELNEKIDFFILS